MPSAPRTLAAVLAPALLVAACAAPAGRSDGPAGAPEPAGPVVATPEAPPPVAAAPDAPGAPAAPAPRNYEKVRIKVSGMTCPIRCIREVKDQLRAVPGVLHVEIDSDTKVATVDVVPGTDPETVAAGLHGDYRGRVL